VRRDKDTGGSPERPITGPREAVYEDPHKKIYRVTVDFGGYAKEMFVSDHGERAAVVVSGPSGILLTRQYRFLIDRVSWEVPGGGIEPDEHPDVAAQRECLEETGVACRDLVPLINFMPGLDTLNNPTHLFYTASFDDTSAGATSSNEVIGSEWLPLDRCIAMVRSGEIADSLTVIALLSYHTFV
jgi:8-oxo-dGTP pyrophosphatase MutT (NUDIX family)